MRKGLLNDATIGLWDTAALQVRGRALWLDPAVLQQLAFRVAYPALCTAVRARYCFQAHSAAVLTSRLSMHAPVLWAGGAHPCWPAAAHPGTHRSVPPHPAASHACAQGAAARVSHGRWSCCRSWRAAAAASPHLHSSQPRFHNRSTHSPLDGFVALNSVVRGSPPHSCFLQHPFLVQTPPQCHSWSMPMPFLVHTPPATLDT